MKQKTGNILFLIFYIILATGSISFVIYKINNMYNNTHSMYILENKNVG